MSYYLQFDGVNDHCTLASPILGVGEFSIHVEMYYAAGINQTLIGNPESNDDIIRFNSDQHVLLNLGGTAETVTFSTPLVGGTFYDFYIQRNASNVLDIVDASGASLINTPKTNSAIFGIYGFGRISAGNYFAGGIRSLRLYDSAARTTLLNHWVNDTGTGSILPDTVASNDATLVNFPTDDSQWVADFPDPSLTITNADAITPGATLTATASNFSAAPTTISLSDGASPALTPTLTATASGDDYDLSALIADFKAQADTAGEGVAVQGLRIGTITATVE